MNLFKFDNIFNLLILTFFRNKLSIQQHFQKWLVIFGELYCLKSRNIILILLCFCMLLTVHFSTFMISFTLWFDYVCWVTLCPPLHYVRRHVMSAVYEIDRANDLIIVSPTSYWIHFYITLCILCMLVLGYNQYITKILRYPEIFRLLVTSLMKLSLSIYFKT